MQHIPVLRFLCCVATVSSDIFMIRYASVRIRHGNVKETDASVCSDAPWSLAKHLALWYNMHCHQKTLTLQQQSKSACCRMNMALLHVLCLPVAERGSARCDEGAGAATPT